MYTQKIKGGAMSRSYLLILWVCGMFFSQTHSNFYNGELSFDYNGAMNGSFYGNLINPDSLSLNSSGAFCFINTDSSLSRIIVPAFQPSLDQPGSIDLFFLYMTDSGTEIEPQQWDVVTPDPSNPENTTATILFIPEIDSTQVMDIIAPILNGEVDSTNFADYLLETLTALVSDSYLPLSGEIDLDTIDTEAMSGGFDGTLFQAGFPPPIVYITNGSFYLTAPAGQVQPSPPADFTIQQVGSDALLQWSFTGTDTLISFTRIHKRVNDDSLWIDINIDVPYPEVEFYDTDVEPLTEYSYYLTLTNILGFTSAPSDTLEFYFEAILQGDLNMDNNIDVLDIVSMVNFILGADTPSDDEMWAGDMNSDGSLDVLDVVAIVNIILAEN